MGGLPVELEGVGLPDGHSRQKFAPRAISIEEAIGRQLDRIAYLRSIGAPWAEAVYQLRDMAVGLEDKEFYDGIPSGQRKKMEGLSDDAKEEMAARYAEDGWHTHHVRAVRGPGGEPVYRPSAENLSVALRIVMRLLARRGIVWRTRTVSDLGETRE